MMNNTIPQTETWQKIDYPDRYYAYSDNTTCLGGFPRASWVDVDIFSQKPDWLPIASDMIALTDAEWSARSLVNQIIKDGKVQTYVPETTTATTGSTTAASDITTTTNANTSASTSSGDA